MVQVKNVHKNKKTSKRERKKIWNFPFFSLPIFSLKSNLTSYIWVKAAQKRERHEEEWKVKEKMMARIPCKFHGLNYHMLHVTHIYINFCNDIKLDVIDFLCFFAHLAHLRGWKKSFLPLLFLHLLPNMPAVARSTIFTAS